MSDESIVSLMSKPPFLRVMKGAVGVPCMGGTGAGPADTSLEEERREVLDSVLDALAANPPDPDQLAACRHLLRRLTETAGPRGADLA